ncbi:efflux protein [Naematelia encephala]|uniref:Efflux protein n=1 Tax=Naematelia encephala TaxID=71784 RepID=A0A1Y2BFZ0_9TREE|nr:efflux protein [Naematelia encephala]
MSTDLTTAEAVAGGTAVLPPDVPEGPLATAGSITTVTSREHELGLPLSPNSVKQSVPLVPILSNRSLPPSPASAPPSPIAPRPPLSRGRLILIAGLVTFTMCMSAGGQQSLNIALPTIQDELGMKYSDLQWISSAYSLTNGCFLLLSGRLADVHGRKLVFLCGLSWYAIWNLVGGFMHSGAGLVVTRALAGSGAAMSTPSAIGIIATTFTGKSRSTAFAAFSAGAPVGGGIGLVLGGLLTSYASTTWRACLWVFCGLATGIGILAFFFVPSDAYQTEDKRIDWIGAALVTVGLIFLQFVISDGQNAPHGWRTSYIIALLIVSVFLLVGFFVWERYVVYNTTRPPLMRLQLWTRAKGKLASVYLIGFVSWMGFTSLMYHATLFFQDVQGTGPIGAMLRFLPTSISGILCNVLVAFLITKVPTQWIVCVGIMATGIASVLFAVAPADTIYWRYPFNGMWLSVMGADFLMATGMIFVAALSLHDEQSVAGALFQTLVQIGGSFGLSLTTVISDSYQSKALNAGKSSVDAELQGIHAAFWLGAGCSFGALIIAAVMLRGMGTIGRGVKRSGGGEPKEERVSVNDAQVDRGNSEEEDKDLHLVDGVRRGDENV